MRAGTIHSSNWQRVLGLVAIVLAVRADSVADEDRLVLRFVGGETLRGAVATFEGDELRWRLPSGHEVDLPRAAVEEIDDAAGTPLWTASSGKPWIARQPVAEMPAEAASAESPTPLADSSRRSPTKWAELASSDLAALPLVGEIPVAAERILEPLVTMRPGMKWVTDRVFDRAADWTQKIEIGGRFIDGNSNEDQLNVQGDLQKKTDFAETKVQIGGFLGRSDNVVNTNRWFANGTTDLNHSDGDRWLVFLTSRNEYDEFENLDYRGTLSAGLGYRIINGEKRQLTARIGPGVTVELFRDPYRERVTGDLFGEIESRWPLYERLTFEQKTTITPSVADFEVFRVVGLNNFLLPLDEQERWNLKLGLRVEYNSRPNEEREPTDYTSTLLLVYKRK